MLRNFTKQRSPLLRLEIYNVEIGAKNIVYRQDKASIRKAVPEEDNVVVVPEAIHEDNVDTVWDTDKVRRRFQYR
jgi:hypothetical protein